MPQLDEVNLNKERFIGLLTNLIGETQHLQNNPPKYLAEEDRAGRHVLNLLLPLQEANTGLTVKQLHFGNGRPPADGQGFGRGNIIIEYASSPAPTKVISFVGSHLDVVVADPATWERDPFCLQVEGDKLYGRGTTDCLGHVALLTDLMVQLATDKVDIGDVKIIIVFIVDEEYGGGTGDDCVGIEALHAAGHLEECKKGPVIWLDCANKQPNIGSGGLAKWRLTAEGKSFHSGFPHRAVNALELGSDAVSYIQKAFYNAFPPHPNEKAVEEGGWGFESCSSLKPTRAQMTSEGSLNQIPGEFVVMGDIRLTPFYQITEAQRVVERAVQELNDTGFAALHEFNTRGPSSRYVVPAEHLKGNLKLEWLGTSMQGVACDLHSVGFKLLCNATREVLGDVKPYSDTGSLPLVADLKADGFDLQMVGYGIEDAYHADNEWALYSDYVQGFEVIRKMISAFKQQ